MSACAIYYFLQKIRKYEENIYQIIIEMISPVYLCFWKDYKYYIDDGMYRNHIKKIIFGHWEKIIYILNQIPKFDNLTEKEKYSYNRFLTIINIIKLNTYFFYLNNNKFIYYDDSFDYQKNCINKIYKDVKKSRFPYERIKGFHLQDTDNDIKSLKELEQKLIIEKNKYEKLMVY